MPPICDKHEVFKEPVNGVLICVPCLKDFAQRHREWQDEEADVNDAKTPPAAPLKTRSGDHIYPRLHGTGGIGPGTWKRGALAAAQEDKAWNKRTLAAAIVLLATEDLLYALAHPGSESRIFNTLADKIAKLI